MRIILGRKGLAINDLQGIAFTLVLIVSFISVGLLVNSSLQTQLPTGTYYNESVTYTNATVITPTCTPILGVSRMMNTSNELLSGNWTNDNWGITLTVLTKTGTLDAGTWLTTYSCGNSSSYRAVSNSTKGLSNLAGWLPVIAVVLAAAMVITAIFSWVYTRREL
jgi:hypothetical protein